MNERHMNDKLLVSAIETQQISNLSLELNCCEDINLIWWQVDTAFAAGSMVWAKIKGFPWWPALVGYFISSLYYETSNTNLP